MAEDIQNPIEHSTFRSEWVQNQAGGTIAITNTTGEERLQLSHHSGANFRFDNKCASLFSPNTQQTLTLGKCYSTVGGDSFERVVKHKETRVNGNYNIITGDDRFFTDDVASEYVEANREIAAAVTSPEKQYGAVGNNTKTEFPDNGTPNSKTGSVSKGSYPDGDNDVQGKRKARSAEINELERSMCIGGHINLMSCKHIILQAGTTAVNYDSGRVAPNGQDVVQKWQWAGTGDTDEYGADNSGAAHKEVRTSAPIYESCDTSSALPFGDIHLNAMGKINMQTGSGGMSVQSAGEVKLVSTGRVSVGGHEVLIGGGSGSDTGTVRVNSDTLFAVKAGNIISEEAQYINNIGSTQITHITPKVHCTTDVHIERDLRVQRNAHIQGDLHVHGNITCNGNITCDGDMIVKGGTGITVPNGDVVAGPISLRGHRHLQKNGNDAGGGAITTSPI